jgi:hypothetical protein
MNARSNMLLVLAAICALACNSTPDDADDPGNGDRAKSAVETNVVRDSCEDAGTCDGGEPVEAPQGDETACEDDDDCPDDLRCNASKICSPRVAR